MFSLSIPADTVFGQGNRGRLQKHVLLLTNIHTLPGNFILHSKCYHMYFVHILITEQYKNEIFILTPPVSEILKLHQYIGKQKTHFAHNLPGQL